MSELSIRTAYTCSQNEAWSASVRGSKGDMYTVRWSYQWKGDVQFAYECTCPAFKFSKEKRHCKHIDQVMGKRCNWNQELDPTAVPWVRPTTDWERAHMEHLGQDRSSIQCCPQCKGPVLVKQVGV